MKLVDTNKDVIFAMIMFIWLYLGILIVCITKNDLEVWIYNLIMASLFGILTLFKFILFGDCNIVPIFVLFVVLFEKYEKIIN